MFGRQGGFEDVFKLLIDASALISPTELEHKMP